MIFFHGINDNLPIPPLSYSGKKVTGRFPIPVGSATYVEDAMVESGRKAVVHLRRDSKRGGGV